MGTLVSVFSRHALKLFTVSIMSVVSAKGMLTSDQSFFPAFSELIILFFPLFLIVLRYYVYWFMFVKLPFHSRNEIDFHHGGLYSFLGVVNFSTNILLTNFMCIVIKEIGLYFLLYVFITFWCIIIALYNPFQIFPFLSYGAL